MDHAVKLLKRIGWTQDPEGFGSPDDGPVRPPMRWEDRRAVVGAMWTTFYRVPKKNTVTAMESVRTNDDSEIRRAGKL